MKSNSFEWYRSGKHSGGCPLESSECRLVEIMFQDGAALFGAPRGRKFGIPDNTLLDTSSPLLRDRILPGDPGNCRRDRMRSWTANGRHPLEPGARDGGVIAHCRIKAIFEILKIKEEKLWMELRKRRRIKIAQQLFLLSFFLLASLGIVAQNQERHQLERQQWLRKKLWQKLGKAMLA